MISNPAAGSPSVGQSLWDSDVLGDAATQDAIAVIVDERPIGGASLSGGTSGGGLFAVALSSGRVALVNSAAEFLVAVSGDTPSVILVKEGTYDFTLSAGSAGKACVNPCIPNTPVTNETLKAANCAVTATLIDVVSTYATARVGDNKTIVGLGAGGTLRNLQLDLSGSFNIILRNLSLVDINPEIQNDGHALQMWPADHVWIDHCTFRNVSASFMHVASSWDETNNQAMTAAAGYITVSWNHFDGRTAFACGGQEPNAISTNRNPALTFHHNWFDTTNNWNPYLFGPGTWGHLFNNTWSNVTNISVAASCGSAALLQGNAFENARDSVYVNDNGYPTWKFCAAGLFGIVYAPTAVVDDEQNLLDATSPMSLNGQTTDGTSLTLPVRQSGNAFRITVPASPMGGSASSYDYKLESSPSSVSALVKSGCGVGYLF